MEDKKWTIKMLAAKMDVSIDGLADLAGISRNHLQAVNAGRAKMLADDVMALSAVTNTKVSDIETVYVKR